tara:strand:- start:691 stop:924 length:234 start_codon:yes stop_codon:yes gene_type:complete
MAKPTLLTDIDHENNNLPSKPGLWEDSESEIQKQLKTKSKSLNTLESNLIDVFIDPFDSIYRRRYIKRFIYGENIYY